MTQSPHVLLVDREPVLRGATALLLGKRGAQTSTAANLDEAIDQVGERLFDVAVLDVSGPGASREAWDVVRALRSTGTAPRRFVVCSDRPLVAPVDEHDELLTVLEKPYGFDRLLEAIFGAREARRPVRSGTFPRARAVKTPKRAAQGRRDRG